MFIELEKGYVINGQEGNREIESSMISDIVHNEDKSKVTLKRGIHPELNLKFESQKAKDTFLSKLREANNATKGGE
jgi:hypothetical protein|nr:MAG TPA: hypothetical protein [Caudoviricetes sp.]